MSFQPRDRMSEVFVRFCIGTAFATSLLTSCHPIKNRDNEANYSSVHSDSGIRGRPYPEIVAELQSLQTTYPTLAKAIIYGKSVQGRDLAMIRIAKPGISVPTHSGVLIEGSIHGDEFLNIEDRLPRWILEHQDSPGVAKYLNSGGIIWIAPILNPDGYTARTRENTQGQDLNRDFDLKMVNKSGFTQPETKLLYDTLKQELASQSAKMKLTFDYHCCVGALIYPWGHSETEELPSAAKKEHLRVAGMVTAQFPNYPVGRAIQIVNYTALGASDDFFHETFDSTSFTFEGAEGSENRNFDRHTAMWDQLLADQAGTGTPQGGQGQTLPPGGGDNGKATLAVISGDRDGRLKFAAATGTTATVSLCRGAPDVCKSNGAVVATFQFKNQAGSRNIYLSSDVVSVTNGEVFTLLAKDGAGLVTESAAIKVSARP